MIAYFASSTPPSGWLKCDGSAVSRTTYSDLFAIVGTTYGSGDGSTTFNLPDLRGTFVRCLNDGSTRDPGRTLTPNEQLDSFASHSHGVTENPHTHSLADPGHTHSLADPGHGHSVNDPSHSHGSNITYAGNQVPSVATSGASGSTKSGVWSTAGMGGPSSYPQVLTDSSGTGITVNGNTTNISINSKVTGITANSTTTGVTVNSTGSTETRPRNIALLCCIKY